MVLPMYLTLSEAAKRLADNTGEPVTPNWLLQHAIDGRLQLFHILRRGFIADFDSASESYQPGTYLPLNTSDAQWILAQPDNDWIFQVPTVHNASGHIAWVLDWITGKRGPIDVAFNDLRVKWAEIDMLATSHSAPLEMKEGEPNPAGMPALTGKALPTAKEEKEKRRELEAEFNAKREEHRLKTGRYGLAIAAEMLAENEDLNVDMMSMSTKLFKSAGVGELRVYERGIDEVYQFNPAPNWESYSPLKDSEHFLEANWEDLNAWLDINEPGIYEVYKFTSPAVSPDTTEDSAKDDAEIQAAYTESIYNGRAIDWRYWVLQMPRLTAAQAARLMSALDPDIFENLDARPNKNDPSKRCDNAKKMQRLAEIEGKLTAPPAEWMEWAKERNYSVHIGFKLAVLELGEVTPADVDTPAAGEVKVPEDTNQSNGDWIVKARTIADSIGLMRWELGTRQINPRNICEGVAEELGKDKTTWGKQGPRGADNVRNVGLRGWKFTPPMKAPTVD